MCEISSRWVQFWYVYIPFFCRHCIYRNEGPQSELESCRVGYRPRMIQNQNASRFSGTSDSLIVPHQNGTKQGRRCNHANATNSLFDIWAIYPWLWPAGHASQLLPEMFWSRGWTNRAGISQFGEVARYSGLRKFYSCAVYCEALHGLSHLLEIALFQSFPVIHDHRWWSARKATKTNSFEVFANSRFVTTMRQKLT